MGVNKVIILGNLGHDPELRYTANQTPVSTLRVATNERRRDASGNGGDHTEWHNVVVFGKTAENCVQYLSKGRQVYVEGRLQTRKWKDRDGNDRYTTEIVASTVQFVGNKASADFVSNEAIQESSEQTNVLDSLPSADEIAGNPEVSFSDDDIPF